MQLVILSELVTAPHPDEVLHYVQKGPVDPLLSPCFSSSSRPLFVCDTRSAAVAAAAASVNVAGMNGKGEGFLWDLSAVNALINYLGKEVPAAKAL